MNILTFTVINVFNALTSYTSSCPTTRTSTRFLSLFCVSRASVLPVPLCFPCLCVHECTHFVLTVIVNTSISIMHVVKYARISITKRLLNYFVPNGVCLKRQNYLCVTEAFPMNGILELRAFIVKVYGL